MKNVVVLDYGLGNLYSVLQACKEAQINAKISCLAEDIESADGIILPGVGAFGHAMVELQSKGLTSPLIKFARAGKPLLGICLGMQLLMETSEEFGHHNGLSLVKGHVHKFPPTSNGTAVKVPHMGWDTININNKEHPAVFGFQDKTDVYFVHSYYVRLSNPKNELTSSEYGGIYFSSSLVSENIWGFQFHPEKSGSSGIQLYKNWANYFRLKG
jgi:glutamine amidotransferase